MIQINVKFFVVMLVWSFVYFMQLIRVFWTKRVIVNIYILCLFYLCDHALREAIDVFVLNLPIQL